MSKNFSHIWRCSQGSSKVMYEPPLYSVYLRSHTPSIDVTIVNECTKQVVRIIAIIHVPTHI